MDMFDDQQPRKKALVDALGGASDAPLGMPGSPANPNTGIGGTPDLGQIAAPPLQAAAPSAPAQKFNTKLMEGDAGKLADVSHAAKSPKYDFLQLAQKGTHDYNDLGGMLSELQGGANNRLWQGWSADGDKLRFKGDPAQLAPEWNGVREVDAIGGFHDPKGPSGFRWGADDGGSAQAELPQAGGGRPSFAGSTISPMLQGDAQAGIQAALQNIGGLADSSKLQELIKALSGGVA